MNTVFIARCRSVSAHRQVTGRSQVTAEVNYQRIAGTTAGANADLIPAQGAITQRRAIVRSDTDIPGRRRIQGAVCDADRQT